jgi:hypothetical protein
MSFGILISMAFMVSPSSCFGQAGADRMQQRCLALSLHPGPSVAPEVVCLVVSRR